MGLEGVSIAALAGSHEGLRRLAPSIPRDFPAPILVLPYDDEGIRLMSDLSFHTSIEVCWAQSGVRLKRGTIYVCPPACSVLARNERHVAIEPAAGPGADALDRSLTSISEVYGAGTLLIELAGSSGGVEGASRIRFAGGTVMVEEGSPRSAALAAAGIANHVLPLEAIAAALVRLGIEFSIPARLSQELQVPLDRARRVWDTGLGNIQLLNAVDRTLHIAAHHGFKREFLEHFRVVRADDGASCSRALRDGRRIVVEDVTVDPEFAPHLSIVAAAGYRSVQSTPIMGPRGHLLGVLSTHSPKARTLTAREADAMDECANEAAERIAAWM